MKRFFVILGVLSGLCVSSVCTAALPFPVGEELVYSITWNGIPVKDGTLYCTISPCLMCAKMIINAGLTEVVYEHEYHFNAQTRALFVEAGVKCRQFERDAG